MRERAGKSGVAGGRGGRRYRGWRGEPSGASRRHGSSDTDSPPAARDPLGFLPPRLQELIRRGEGPRVEFKSRLPEERRLARLLAALANSGGGVILIGIDDCGGVCGGSGMAEVEAGLAVASGALEPRPLITLAAWEDAEQCVVEARVRPPVEGGPVREVFGSVDTILVRVDDHVQPVSRLLESAHWTTQRRLSSLPADTRERFARFYPKGGNARRFRVQEYARIVNVSPRTARRDLVWLVRASLVLQVQKGLFATERFDVDGDCGT